MNETPKTPDAILRAAAHHPAITAEQMGMITDHVRLGEYGRARQYLAEADRRSAEKEAVPLPRDLSALTDAVNAMRTTLAQLEKRMKKLEAQRPVAKAANPTPKRPRTTEDLMRMIDAYVDSPTTAGILSGLLQSGDPAQRRQAERALVDAKRGHEAQKARNERRGWQS